MKTIPLAISAKDELIHEVSELRKTYDIHCFVGTYDPKIFGIPFIPISKIFENSQEEIDRILMFEPISSSTFNYEDVYQYLSEQFKYVSISKLKSILPGIIDELNTIYHFNEDQRVGLFMHMACLSYHLSTIPYLSYVPEFHCLIMRQRIFRIHYFRWDVRHRQDRSSQSLSVLAY